MPIQYTIERDTTPGNLPLYLAWYEYPENQDKQRLIHAINNALTAIESEDLLNMETNLRILPNVFSLNGKVIRTEPHITIITSNLGDTPMMNVFDDRTRKEITVELDPHTARYLAECIAEHPVLETSAVCPEV